MKLIINGAGGRMGRVLLDTIDADPRFELAAAVDSKFTGSQPGQCALIENVSGRADCIIDFSHHSASPAVASYAAARRIPLVIATTGQSAQELAVVRDCSRFVPILISGNMSVGIATLVDLVKRAVKIFPDADVEIIETHHNQKLDVPSGTALMIAEGIRSVRRTSVSRIGRHENGRRASEEVGIHSVRMGNIVGEHEVLICTGNQTLSLKHTSHSRALFADGALSAALFVADKVPGIYAIEDMFR